MRRLNVKLTLWLLGITLVSVVGVHFLHGFQIDRNADFLKVQAEKARQDGNDREAIKLYGQYLKHRDDADGYDVLTEMAVTTANDSGTMRDRVAAYNYLLESVRRHQDLHVARRRLIDFTMSMRRYPEALEHIKYLLEHDQKGSDLDMKLAQCYLETGEEEKGLKRLYELVGFDEQTNQFSEQAPPGLKQIAAFETLARHLSRKNNTARADMVMSQLVHWSPDSAEAHLARAKYLISASAFKTDSAEFIEAKTELDRAFELAPDNIDVILTSTTYLMAIQDYSRAEELLNKALQLSPARQEVHLQFARLKLIKQDVRGAEEALKLGLTEASEVNLILEQLIDVELQLNDMDEVRATCKLMHERGTFAPEMLRFQDARIKFVDGEMLEASREFEAIRPAVARMNYFTYAQQIDVLLGQCYELLGQYDRELEVYRRVPADILRARLGEATALQYLGRYDEANAPIKLLKASAKDRPTVRNQILQLLINAEMQKPEEDRDWTEVDSIVDMMIQDKSRPELDNMLLKADLTMLHGQLDDARKILTTACKQFPKDIRPWIALVRLLARDNDNSGKISQLLDLAQKEAGDVLMLRLQRIREVMRKGGDQRDAELHKLEQGLDVFPVPQRSSIMFQLAMSYGQIRNYPDSKRCWKYVLENDPKNAQARQMLFEIAVDNKDEVTALEVAQEIHDSHFFGPQTALYKYCAATAKQMQLKLHSPTKKNPMPEDDRKALAQIRKLVDDGLAIRGEWSPLWRVRAEVDQYEGDLNGAIANYQRALQYSHAGTSGIAQRLVQLLYIAKRFSEANDVLKYAGQTDSGSSDVMGRTVQDIIFIKGDVARALEMARKDAENEPSNPIVHIWLGRLLERAGMFDEAEDAFRKATVADPNVTESWNLLVRRLVANKKSAEAVDAVREAAKSFAEEPGPLAKLYQQVGDNERAEHLYKTALEKHPDDLVALRALVEFYFNTKRGEQAVTYLDQIIQKTSKSTDPADVQQLAIARRFKAQTLAAAGDYEHIVAATKLIEQNGKNGVLAPDDMRAIILMLIVRPEPESRNKAMLLLESLQKQRPLTPREQSLLGQIYERAGKWSQARDLMLSAIARNSNDIDILFPFAKMLLRHEEFDDAARWVDRLEELASNPKSQISLLVKQNIGVLRARLLVKDGKQDEAVRLLEGFLPRPLPPNQLSLLDDVAQLMEELELYDAAEKLLGEYVAQEPRGMVAMAAFLSRRDKVDEAFALLEKSRKSRPVSELMPCALYALRRQPEKATDARRKMLEDWIASALEDEANTQAIKLMQAELYSFEGRTAEAIKIYRDELANPKNSAVQKAVVQNNLAYILATAAERPEIAAEAVKLANDAMRVMGPTPELLDTRGLSYMAQGKLDQALSDLQVAAPDSPTGSKYFHLAQAEMRAKHLDAARNAIAKATEIGLDDGQTSPSDRKLYAKLVDELKQ